MIWDSFFKEMEKKAIIGALAGPALIGGVTALDVNSTIKDNKKKMRLSSIPLRQDARYKLTSQNFSGGKRIDSRNTRAPDTLYG